MKSYDFKQSYYLSGLSDNEYYCGRVDNYLVVIRSMITTSWEVKETGYEFRGLYETTLPYPPKLTSDTDEIDLFPEIQIIGDDYLSELTYGEFSIHHIDYHLVYDICVPDYIVHIINELSNQLDIFSLINSIVRVDPDGGREIGDRLKNMIFDNDIPIYDVNDYCQSILTIYNYLFNKVDNRVPFQYNEY